MTKEQIEQVIQDTFTQFKGSDRGAMVLACRQLFETYYTPLDASHRELVEVLEGVVNALSTTDLLISPAILTTLSNAKKLINETE
jgi:hypothetical protein